MKSIIHNPLYAQATLLILWLIVQLILYKVTGVKIANDSPRYIFHANRLIEAGVVPAGQNFWYVGYIGFLAFFRVLDLGYSTVVGFQVFLSGLAALALYQATLHITGRNFTVAVFATALYVLWPKIQLWNFYILTDSLFASMMIISFWALVYIKNWQQGIAVLPLFLFAFLVRPSGIGFLVAVAAFVYFTALIHYKKTAVRTGLWLFPLLIVFTFLLLNKMLIPFKLIETYARGEVIFLYQGVLVDGGDQLNLPDWTEPPLFKLFYFIVHNPVYFIKLVCLKLFFFFSNGRPYYSLVHNVFLLLLLPVYYFAVKGGISKKILSPPKAFIITFIIFQAFIVMLTVEDWDGRFLVPVLPFVFVLAATGFYLFLQKKKLLSNVNILWNRWIKY